MQLIFSHFDMSHLLRSQLKEEAEPNMVTILLQFDVTHLLRSELKEEAD